MIMIIKIVTSFIIITGGPNNNRELCCGRIQVLNLLVLMDRCDHFTRFFDLFFISQRIMVSKLIGVTHTMEITV